VVVFPFAFVFPGATDYFFYGSRVMKIARGVPEDKVRVLGMFECMRVMMLVFFPLFYQVGWATRGEIQYFPFNGIVYKFRINRRFLGL
jgi:hypothetical protein